MSHATIRYSDARDLSIDHILALYRASAWSSADKPTELHNALLDSHALVSAWAGDILVGIGNSISDGHLVVYYPHLLVLPDYQRQGIGQELMRRLIAKYRGFHQHVLFADGEAVEFYRKCGFSRAGRTESMWIYSGEDH